MPKKSSDKVSKAVRRYNKLQQQVEKNTMMLAQTVEGKQIYRTAEQQSLALNTFSVYSIFDGLAQGVADTGTGSTTATGARIGNSINVKSITLHMLLDGQNQTADPTNPNAKVHGNYRVIIYNSPCGADLDETDILRAGSTTDQAVVSHYKVDIAQGKEYEIWSDQRFCLSDAKPCKFMNFTKRWKHGKQVIYNNNNTSPSNFNPKVLVIADKNNFDDFSYSFKVRYEDL